MYSLANCPYVETLILLCCWCSPLSPKYCVLILFAWLWFSSENGLPLPAIIVVVVIIFLIRNLVNTECVQLGSLLEITEPYVDDTHGWLFPKSAHRSLSASLLSHQFIPLDLWDLIDSPSQQLYNVLREHITNFMCHGSFGAFLSNRVE